MPTTDVPGADPGTGDPLDTMTDDELIRTLGLDDDEPGTLEAAADDDEAPTAAALDAEAAEDEAEGASAAQPRDEHGRFVPKASQAEAQGEQQPDEAATPTSAPADAPQPATTAPPGVTAERAAPPATYAADGQNINIDGSAVGEDGVFIPAQAWRAQVQPLLAAGHHFHHGWRERASTLNQRVQDAETRAQSAEQTVQELYVKMDQLVKDPEAFEEWRANAEQHWEVWKVRAEKQALEVQLEQRAQRDQTAQQQQAAAQREPEDDRRLASVVDWITAEGQPYTAVDKQRALRQLRRLRTQVLVDAPEDDPAQRWRKGDRLVDWGLVHEVMKDELDLLNRSSTAATAALEKSRRQVGQRVTHPPVAAGGRAPGVEAGLPTPKTREEADRLLEKATRAVR